MSNVNNSARMNVPVAYKFIIKYVTPLFLVAILVSWFIQEGVPTIFMKGVPAANRPFVFAARALLAGIFVLLAALVKIAWRKKRAARKI